MSILFATVKNPVKVNLEKVEKTEKIYDTGSIYTCSGYITIRNNQEPKVYILQEEILDPNVVKSEYLGKVNEHSGLYEYLGVLDIGNYLVKLQFNSLNNPIYTIIMSK